MISNDYENGYQGLLCNSNKTTKKIRRLIILAVKIFKILNENNPLYMKIYSRLRKTPK